MLTKNLTIPFLLFVLGVSLCFTVKAHAAPNNAPHALNFSGYLTDMSGTPIAGSGQDLIFELSIGGNILWCAEYENITASAGMISVTLGAAGAQVGTGGRLNPTGTATHCQSVANGGGPGGAPTPIASSLLTTVTSATAVALNVQIYEAGAWQLFSTSFPISSSLFSLQAENAENVGGVPAAQIAQMNAGGQIISSVGSIPVIDTNGNWIGPAISANNISGGSLSGSVVSGGTLGATNGSNITNISSGNLTGALPAISGTSLTNLNASSISSGTMSGSYVSGGTFGAVNASNLTNIPGANVTGTLPVGTIPSLSGTYLPLSGASPMSGNLTLGGNTIYGSSAASGNLTLQSSSSTLGYVLLAPTGGNVGIGTATPQTNLDVNGGIRVGNVGAAACTAAIDGTIQYLSASDTYEQCFGALTTWMVVEPQTTWQAITANTTAVAGGRYAINTAGGAVTLTLPAAPAVGNRIGIVDSNNSFATNNLTVGANGNNIMALAQDMTVANSNVSFELVYLGATLGWRIK